MTKIKVEASDLEIGMYVCELDRPWLESPFLFQGFLLESSEDVQDVANACEYVFVELANSSETVRSRLQSLASSQNRSTTVQEATPSNQANDDEGYAYKEHLYLARKIYDHTRSYIDKTLTAVGEGSREVDTEQAKSLVNEMIDNILVKPHAMAWLTHLKNRDEYTLTHSINVCILALTFGRHMQLPREQLEILGLGALLHDIGKLRVPPEILNKPDRLTREEFEIMKKHPVEGYNILREDLLMSPEILDIVLHHHERISGQGYPEGMLGDSISRLTKMTSIVDVFDAITSDRCYHDGLSPYIALQNIYRWTDNAFDKILVEGFMGCMGLYPVGSVVELNQGQIAIVIATTPKTKLRPMLLLLTDKEKHLLKTRQILNLSLQDWEKTTGRLEIKNVIDPKTLGIDIKSILEQESMSA
ncbi:MAG: HD-GYP domain-containing protein [Gammaproteobacteria bacterium]